MSGRLFGVGLGPGDPELLTLKAARVLREAPVIAYPLSEGGESLARSIAEPHLGQGQREIAIELCMSTERAPGQGAYDRAAPRIAAELDAGHDVAVLCEGDPFFYGSFLQLLARLVHRYPTEIVPGISSVMAAAARTRRPLCARDDRFAVLPATLADDALLPAIAAADSVAILKLGRHFARVKALIEGMGLTDRATYAERIGQAGERVLPLGETGETAPYFAMILLYKGAEPAILDALNGPQLR